MNMHKLYQVIIAMKDETRLYYSCGAPAMKEGPQTILQLKNTRDNLDNTFTECKILKHLPSVMLKTFPTLLSRKLFSSAVERYEILQAKFRSA